ncbi:MAG: hypothetical protein WB763_05000 [Terriglobia bacterium]|jgi:hypothetical protein
MTDQRGNVYENKGPAFSRPRQSGNVTENKGSYALKAGMLLKRKDVGGEEQDSGFGIQESEEQRTGDRAMLNYEL